MSVALASRTQKEESPKKKVTWRHITTKSDFVRALKVLRKYVEVAPFKDDWGVFQPARLAVDCETFRPDGNRKKFPFARWDGNDFEFRIRLLQVGLDPLYDGYFSDRQFLFDVVELGIDYVIAGLQDILEHKDVVCIGHSTQYDGALLDWHGCNPKWIDTKLISQVRLSGKRTTHRLIDLYKRLIPRSKFIELTGMSQKQYSDDMKKFGQEADWSEPCLSPKLLQYAADDVRLIWWAWDRLMDQIEDHEHKYERKFPDGQGVQTVITWEHKILPVFTRMEQRGLKVDWEYHRDVVVPLLELKRDEARAKFYKWKEFRRKKNPNEHDYTYTLTVSHQGHYDVSLIAKQIRSEVNRLACKSSISNLSVTSGRHAEGDHVFLKWSGTEDTTDYVLDVANTWLGGIAKCQENVLLNFDYYETMQNILTKVLGFPVKSAAAKKLRRFKDGADERQSEILTWILRYSKAKTYASKFGRNFQRHINARGYTHPSWHQIGSESNEIVTGRSSCSDPPLMQMPSKDFLFNYDGDNGVAAPELFRSMFVPPEDGVFINADYKQIEVCMMAWESGDERLCQVIREDADTHAVTAGMVKKFGKVAQLPDDIDIHELADGIEKSERNKMGKPINFGMSYLMGATSLIDHAWDMTDGEVVLDMDESKRIIRHFFTLYDGLKRAIDKTEQKVCRRAYAEETVAYGQDGSELGISHESTWGRHRFLYLPDYHWAGQIEPEKLDQDYNPTGDRWYYNEFKRRVSKMRRDGWNFKIQGACANLLKASEYYVDRALEKAFAKHPKWNSRLFGLHLVLHDELLVSVPNDRKSIELGKRIVEREMLRAAAEMIDFKVVPVKVQIGVGRNWYAASPK